MGTQDGIGTRPQRETLGRVVGQGVELAVACLISYALILADRSEDVITAAITTTVVMVVAGIAPQHAWIRPILRLLDTNIGMAVGIAAAWASLNLGSQTDRRSPATVQ